MSGKQAAFQRKIAYLVVLALLVYPIWWLSEPTVRGARPQDNRAGGQLAQLRDKYQLSQANLGEIDPASESMKLASLGLNGVAANLLWQKAIHYKKVEDFENLYATLKQIRNLQSNFIAVFEFQGHNISYNVSVELDDYRRRYDWVKHGIVFLIDGITYNKREPRLQWNVGWFISQKIGRADEKVLFRELFRNDTDFHEYLDKYVNLDDARSYADRKPDNWLVGRLWYLDAQRLIDKEGATLRGKSPLVFNSFPPMSLMNFAMASEEEGNLEEQALIAWEKAGNSWEEFGRRQIPSSFGHNIRLGDEEQMRTEVAALVKQLEQITAGVREKLLAEREASLSAEQKAALEIPALERTEEQYTLASEAEETLAITPADIAEAAPADVRSKARQLAAKAIDRQLLADRIARYRTIVNYEYWKMRAEVEQQMPTLVARRLVRDAVVAYNDTDLITAQQNFEEAWVIWADIFERYPQMRTDVTGQDLMDDVKRYFDLMNRQLGEGIPDNFPLRKLVELHNADLLPPLSSKPPKEEESAPVEPAPTEPTAVEPPPTETTPPEPMPEEPSPEEPSSVAPATEKPTPTEPTPEEPAAAEPNAEEPASPALEESTE